MTTTKARPSVARGQLPILALCVIDAGLLVTSGLIHLHFWNIAYRHVPTLGPLFLAMERQLWNERRLKDEPSFAGDHLGPDHVDEASDDETPDTSLN